MKTISHLSPDLIAKIAAGEVVEHPASVVKELVENSLDAGATQVDVELKEGGLSLIQVSDNGKGMSKEDLEVCFLPHTTSKLKTSEDLMKIVSFGFRGEAIWSIAAVSDMHIQSRQVDTDSGNSIHIRESKIIDQRVIGMPVGTVVRVESLFLTTPARRKFMKDTTTETRAVVDVLLKFSLAFPHVGFTLTHNHKTLLDLPQNQTHETRLHAVFGEYMSQHFLPILSPSEKKSMFGKIQGFIGRPQLSGRNRTHQYVYINGRPVSPQLIAKHVSLAYGNLIEPRSFPVFILFLDIPHDHVDVNVHPRKEEVAFIYEQEIATLIQEAIAETLTQHNLTFRDIQDDLPFKGMNFSMASMLRETLTPWNVKDIPEENILQINNLYLLASTDHGLLLIDQHAAHERILYEEFLSAFKEKQSEGTVIQLPEALLLDLPKADALLLEKELSTLQHIGFDIDSFGEKTFKICSVPEVFKNRDIKQTILEVLQQIKEYGKVAHVDKETDRTLSFLACRTAIKGGEALSLPERKRLVEKLLEIQRENKTGYTCPHGRPTHIEITLGELDKMFKRKM